MQVTLAQVLPLAVTFLTPFEVGAEIELTPDGRVIASDPYRLCEWTDVATRTDESVAFDPSVLVQLRDLSRAASRTLNVKVEQGHGLSAYWRVGRREESCTAYQRSPSWSDGPACLRSADAILERAEGWQTWPCVPSPRILAALDDARRRGTWVKLSTQEEWITVGLYPPSGWEGLLTQRFRDECDLGVGSVRVRADLAYWCMKAIGGSWRIPPEGTPRHVLISERPFAVLAGAHADAKGKTGESVSAGGTKEVTTP
jgi:hypothetical protein